MRGIKNEVQSSMDRFSKYLTHACSLMRCNSAINRLNKDESEDSKTVKILRRHQNDILKIINDEVAVFDKIIKYYEVDVSDVQPYDYDFKRIAGYKYNMPLNYMNHKNIELMQKGFNIDIPVDYITGITVDREELYE